ncbi:hemoglobin/transferrin/lactoferrin receptor protein [Thermostichus sp. MS-CIW-21]|jgi:hemoglobin/transferrin/lactoferrin receptor protein|uniref:TonB-dependent hemoglobin/transferrin/lactoferrin family receptor n=1 Tax=unclassified Synechococcus TaxID=2626047 RepID=UPI000C1936D6|nr:MULTISPECIES: TonB-dependent hemoglobin/transferrin/lactoferrin family receptor [unclassified Synechococcus]PIK87854.1 TonB-denpendent receptor [Synechococcus sp. 65AY6A5]PIK96008.1 TonB-denpendent receptor [Synechococcus sp. 60AY4M2]PIL01027.1 TonB-denpendent receptor [Synechococcus sp. 65AY640]
MRVTGWGWKAVSLGLGLGLSWGSLAQAQPAARIPETPLLAQATPRGATTIQEQIRELEAQIEAARRRGDQAEVERLQADLQVLRQGTPVFNLQQVTVTGTRTERTLADSPATITVIDRERLRQELIQNIQDLVRYEPGVSVRRNVRYGLQDFNIRGLDANRVLIQVDGIRQPERFSFGPFNIGRDTFELETLKTVEIIRGPASTLYGSDALGGVVTYTTLDPADLLGERDSHVGLSSQYDSKNQGFVNTLSLAGRQGNLEALLIYTRRDAREPDIKADPSFKDRQTVDGDNVLAKLVYRFSPLESLTLTGEYFNSRTTTTFSRRNLDPGISLFRETIDTERSRLSLEYRYANPENPAFELATAQIYYQPARTREPSVEERTITVQGRPVPVRRDTFNELVSNILGASLQAQSRFQTGDLSHRLVYGMEISTTRNERPRNRFQTNLQTGAVTQNIPPDTFPTKDFPDSDTVRFGLYVQDEIDFGGGNLTLIPGIRYDTYNLTPSPDEAFLKSGSEAASLFADAVSPKLGLVWRINPNLTFTAQYNTGFRAPQYNEINSGFTNLVSPFFRYRTLSNPDLRPETSQGFEVGLRGIYPQASFSLAAYYNTYNDFIEAFRRVGSEPSPPGPPGSPPPPPVILFQSQNVSRARIYGVEATGQYFFSPDLTGWSLNGSFAWAVGDNLTENKPLLSIEPLTAVLGLHYDDPSQVWGARLVATLVADPRDPQREVVQTNPNAPPQIPFVPSGYTVVDLLGYYNLDDNWQLNFGVFNLFDEKYFLYSETRTLFVGPEVERRAQPGRHVALSFSSRF